MDADSQHCLRLPPRLKDYLEFCALQQTQPCTVTREQIALYVRSLATRAISSRREPPSDVLRFGLANATIRLRLTAVRLYHDYLVEEGVRLDNPVSRCAQRGGFGGARSLALVPRYTTLPWIPNDLEWRAVLEVARAGPLRDRLMLALAYDSGLRRGELCSLSTGDLDPARRLLHVRAETMQRDGLRCGVVTLCIGGGHGIALACERVA